MIEFIENAHIYVQNGVIIPSVSEFLRYVFGDRYKDVPEAILEKKRDYGTRVHKYIEKYETDRMGGLYRIDKTIRELGVTNIEEQAAFKQYVKLRTANDFRVMEQEQIVSYDDLFAGRYDMLASVNGAVSLLDIKTVAKLDLEYISWQLSLYELADLSGVDKYEHLYAIWLPKRGLGELVEVERIDKRILIDKLKEHKNYRKNQEER